MESGVCVESSGCPQPQMGREGVLQNSEDFAEHEESAGLEDSCGSQRAIVELRGIR